MQLPSPHLQTRRNSKNGRSREPCVVCVLSGGGEPALLAIVTTELRQERASSIKHCASNIMYVQASDTLVRKRGDA